MAQFLEDVVIVMVQAAEADCRQLRNFDRVVLTIATAQAMIFL